MSEPPDAHPRRELQLFAQKVVIALALAAVAAVLLRWLHVLLLAFGAILMAVLLSALADPVRRRTRLGPGGSVGIVVLALFAVIVGVVVFVGQQISQQLLQLEHDLPGAWTAAQLQIAGLPGGHWLLDQLHAASPVSISGLGPLAGRIGRATTTTVEAVAQVVLVIVAGVYVAAQPQLYRRGILALAPRSRRASLEAAADETTLALRRWLLGTAIAMLVMGVLTAVGTALLGLPAPLALGLLSGLAEFVPIVGAAVSAIPGLLLAAPQGPRLVLATLAFYVAVHQLEGHVLIPLIQRRVVAVPPALTLFAILAFGVLLGPIGVIFATPLAVVLMTLVRRLRPASTGPAS